MPISEKQKKLRRWLRRHGWHTSSTPTGHGFYLKSPVENCAGLTKFVDNPATGQELAFSWERLLQIELDRFTCDFVALSIFKRRHWWKREDCPDLRIRGHGFFSWVPSDDFEEWPIQPAASINLPARDIVKLAELIEAAQADWMGGRETKDHLTFMERIARSCPHRWIGVNSSYDEIKRAYSNERIRQEMQKEKEENHDH